MFLNYIFGSNNEDMKISFNRGPRKKEVTSDNAFTKVFDDIANRYERVTFERNKGSIFVNEKEQHFIMSICQGLSNFGDKKILDIGAGNGRWSKLFLALGCEVYALDSSPEMCRVLSRINKLHVVNSNIEEIHLSEKFDLVFSMRALKYTDLGKALSNIRKVMNDKGTLIVELPYLANPFYFIFYFSSKILIHFFKHNTYLKYSLMINLHSESSIKKLISNSGYILIGIKKLLFFPDFIYAKIDNSKILRLVTSVDTIFARLLPRSLIFIIQPKVRHLDGKS
jgi:SAM-dependent methyltransferase